MMNSLERLVMVKGAAGWLNYKALSRQWESWRNNYLSLVIFHFSFSIDVVQGSLSSIVSSRSRDLVQKWKMRNGK